LSSVFNRVIDNQDIGTLTCYAPTHTARTIGAGMTNNLEEVRGSYIGSPGVGTHSRFAEPSIRKQVKVFLIIYYALNISVEAL
jgi:hypothetical protein